MSTGGSDSDDDHSETQEADERSDEDNQNKNTEETDAAYDESDENDGGEQSANPFLLRSDVQKALQSYEPLMINPEMVEMLQGPPIDPEMVEMLQGPPIDPEIIGQIKQPPIDPQALESLQQTAENIRKLSEFTLPAIDQGVLDALQSVGDPTIIEAYETAAALEQIEQKTGEQKPSDELEEEPDIETESLEEQEAGGHVSTFFNYTATILLFHHEQLSEEATESLVNIRQSESIQTKKDNFTQVVSSLEEKSTRLLSNAAWGAIAFMLMYHFGPQTGETGESPEEEGDE